MTETEREIIEGFARKIDVPVSALIRQSVKEIMRKATERKA